ncbi:MAG: TadE family protein [Chloroflexota bacterium]
MRSRLQREPDSDRARGQALVEFTLVVPIFILLLAGMIDFGFGLYSYMSVQAAAREGARLGTTDCAAADCAAAVTSRTQGSGSGLSLAVAVACTSAAGVAEACTASKTGDTVTVTASYTYNMIWPLAFGTQIPMASSVKMMLE